MRRTGVHAKNAFSREGRVSRAGAGRTAGLLMEVGDAVLSPAPQTAMWIMEASFSGIPETDDGSYHTQ